jgi:hypothetical protein
VTDQVTAPVSDHSRHALDLQLTLVRYDDGPDRCTVAPRRVPDGKRTTTWLSANRAAFEDLTAMR